MVAKKKPADKTVQINVSIVGMQYRLDLPTRHEIAKLIEKSDHLICYLEREPENEFDGNAIKVIVSDPDKKSWAGMHIGYTPRDVSKSLAPLLDRGARVKQCHLNWIEPGQGIGEAQVEITKPSS